MRAAVVCLGLLATPVAASPVKINEADPHPGMHREYWEDAAIPAKIHLVRVDLSSAELRVYATSEANKGIKTSTFAARKSAQLAINGGPFSVAGYQPRGLAMGDTQMWSNVSDDEGTYVLHFRRVGEQTRVAIMTADEVTPPSAFPDGTEGIVSGKPLLVRNGNVVTSTDPNDPVTIPNVRAPRSAVGVSVADSDGLSHYMYLVTVEGWLPGSAGMTAIELGTFIRARGAHNAIGLDIGGAATMILNNANLNRLSDGVERPVANHLAVQWGSQTHGVLTGAICKTSVNNCDAASERVTGVEVTLDDGRKDTVTSTELYEFQNVTPRLACVTARKAGYKTTTACKFVEPVLAPPTYNSLVLLPGKDPVDAGVPDASEVPVDADEGSDGAPRPDAGNPDVGGGGGGCCNTGGDHPPSGTAVLVAVVAFAMGRRRGTKA